MEAKDCLLRERRTTDEGRLAIGHCSSLECYSPLCVVVEISRRLWTHSPARQMPWVALPVLARLRTAACAAATGDATEGAAEYDFAVRPD